MAATVLRAFCCMEQRASAVRGWGEWEAWRDVSTHTHHGRHGQPVHVIDDIMESRGVECACI